MEVDGVSSALWGMAQSLEALKLPPDSIETHSPGNGEAVQRFMPSALQSEVASLSGVNGYELRRKIEEDQAELGENRTVLPGRPGPPGSSGGADTGTAATRRRGNAVGQSDGGHKLDCASSWHCHSVKPPPCRVAVPC